MEEQQSHPRQRKQSFSRSAPDEHNHQYYLQFKQLYEEALVVARHFRQTQKRQNQLLNHINELGEKAESFRDTIRPEMSEFKKKKNRRTADQIIKQHVCPVYRCDRRYGTEASLRIHVKKKHPDIYSPKKKGKSQQSERVSHMESMS